MVARNGAVWDAFGGLLGPTALWGASFLAAGSGMGLRGGPVGMPLGGRAPRGATAIGRNAPDAVMDKDQTQRS